MIQNAKNLYVSVLIPTINRHKTLVDTLNGMLRQEYDPFEIIVYDQTPDHPTVVSAFLDRLKSRIRYVKDSPKGLVYAYRRCVELSTGEVCLFVDDDVVVKDPKFITKHVNHYSDALVGAVSGQVLHEGQYDFRPFDPRAHGPFGWRFVRFDVNEWDPDLSSLCGANMSFRKHLYFQIGGFDLAYEGNGFRFETDFTHQVKTAGYRVIFDPEASLMHRYHLGGGAENHFLLSLRKDSHLWYTQFFANTWYFFRKWYPLPRFIRPLFHVWREHVFNKACLRAGISFQIARHRALMEGIASGERKCRQRQHGLRSVTR